METLPTSPGNHLEIYMHLQALADTMVLGFQFFSTSTAVKNYSPVLQPAMSVFSRAVHVHPSFPGRRMSVTVPLPAGEISIPLQEQLDVRDHQQG